MNKAAVSNKALMKALILVIILSHGISSCSPVVTYKPDPALQEYSPDGETLEILLKEAKGCFDFFWDTANTDLNSPGYGLIPDRMPSGPEVSSIASVGFGLTAICIGVERGWISREQGAERASGTLETLFSNVQQDHGFFYHFLDIKTGQRVWNCEVSIIDTALCLNGVIMASEYFGGDIARLAEKIYSRVEWPWYSDPGAGRFRMGYSPEEGFFGAWDMTAEQMMMYFLGAGSPLHPVNPMMFYMFGRPKNSYGILPEMMYSPAGSLFVYQYSHAWYDFRNTRDSLGADWFRNSTIASLSSWQYAVDNASEYKTGKYEWGFSACDGPNGYSGGYGSRPSTGSSNDGTVPPYGPAGSIVFTPENSARALVHMFKQYPLLQGEWGFKDAYNNAVSPNWMDKDVIGIDKGITLLMIENYLTGTVWKYMMKNRYVQAGMKRCRVFPANTYMVESFEDNTSREGITGEGCMFNIQREEVNTGVKALKVQAASGGKLRFVIDSRLLTDDNNALFRFAAKGSGKILIHYLSSDQTRLKTYEVEINRDGWNTYDIPAVQEQDRSIGNAAFVELEYGQQGLMYLDDIEFINEKPRINNVILYGGREPGSELKAVWNAWDPAGRKIYIDEILWYVSDTPKGDWRLIEDAKGLTYTLKDSDTGRFIRCELRGVIPEGGSVIRLEPSFSDTTKRVMEKATAVK